MKLVHFFSSSCHRRLELKSYIMSHMHRQPHAKHEVKSKIGDYIRGKISAQSLMHPSRVNTKPIDKGRFKLNTTSFNYQMSKTEYQRKARRPPLKDYIEGKVKLSDMISPSKITYIPKEKKYHPEVKRFMSDISDDEYTMESGRESVDEAIKIVTRAPAEFAKDDENWSLAHYEHPRNMTEARNEITLIPIKSANGTRKRKLMCKVKVQHNITNALTYGESAATEHIIEIPEGLLRQTDKIPKFLMDRYNIPCYVGAAKPAAIKRKRPLAILDDDSQNDTSKTQESLDPQIESIVDPGNAMQIFSNFENPIGEGESSMNELSEKKNSVDIENAPLEQGDCNNTTTYIFEFYEEEAHPDMDHRPAIIEEIIEDNNEPYDKEKRQKRDVRRNPETPCSEKFHFEDYKSSIHFQREIIDLQMGMLKCDKNVMFVERNVNQVTASLNMLENIINQEVRPFIINLKTDNQELKLQIRSFKGETQALHGETQELKKHVKYLRKKSLDNDKLIHLIIRQNWKIEELENRLEELNQAQISTIKLIRQHSLRNVPD